MSQKDAVEAGAVADGAVEAGAAVDGADTGGGGGSATAAGRPLRSVVWRLLPPREAIPRWVRRLLTGAAGSLAVGLPDLARVAGEGGGGSRVPTGALAVGYGLLTAALAVPLMYWAAVLSTALGTMAGRRAGVVGRGLRRAVGGLGRRLGTAARSLRRDHPKRGPSAPPRDRPRL